MARLLAAGVKTCSPNRCAPPYALARMRLLTTDCVRVGGATLLETQLPWVRARNARHRCTRLASA